MSKCGHLWAIGFDDMGRAAQVRDEITSLGWVKHDLILLDMAVAVCYPDGSFTLNGEPFPVVTNIFGCTAACFLACLTLGAGPRTAAAVVARWASLAAARRAWDQRRLSSERRSV